MRLYRGYLFIDKDPVIDVIRTKVQDSKQKVAHVAHDSGVSPTTLGNWFGGKTKRPQFATVAAVAGALGTPIRFGTQVVTGERSKAAHDALQRQLDREARKLTRRKGKRKHLPKGQR
jgi:transcriptional regulator with XRE-family HTH domain